MPLSPYRATTCRERELTQDHKTFLTTNGNGGLPRMSDQPNAGASSETAQTWKTRYTIHAPIHSNKAKTKGWLWRPNDIRGACGPEASWLLSYRWGKTPKKNLNQETCPDRGSNPWPLRDRRACYHLFDSGGLYLAQIHVNIIVPSVTRSQ